MGEVKIDLQELLRQDKEELKALAGIKVGRERKEFLKERIAQTEEQLDNGETSVTWSETQFKLWKAANRNSKTIILGVQKPSIERFDATVDMVRSTYNNRHNNKSLINEQDENDGVKKGIDLIGRKK